MRIQRFADLYLSNWYVRLCRRRFWKGEYNEDKISAYQTLYTCLETLTKLIAPIAPFFAEQLYRALNETTGKSEAASVHLSDFPQADTRCIAPDLEEQMRMAQEVSSLILSLRKRNNLKVRQPLSKVMIPVADERMQQHIGNVRHLILAETNLKSIEFLRPDNHILTKTIKPNFKTLGPKYGKIMKGIAAAVAQCGQTEIQKMEQTGSLRLQVEGQEVLLLPEDVEIHTQDIPGWVVASNERITVALDTTVTPELRNEGIARELVNRIQNLRKETQLDVTDRIRVSVTSPESLEEALQTHSNYICAETLCTSLEMKVGTPADPLVELTDTLSIHIAIEKA